MPQGWRRTGLLVGLFFMASLVKVSRHEMWRDEIEFWDAARTSRSLVELRENTRYIGQPPLGHLLLYGLSRLTRDPRAMQFLNVLIVTAAVAIVAAFAPWSTPWKWLFAFGYFPFFEYGTISRPYGLGLLLLVAFCAARARSQRLGPSAGVLGLLLALSHFHATIIVIAIVMAVGAESLWERRRPTPGEWLAVTLLIAGIAASVAYARPPSDSRFLQPWDRNLGAAPLFGSFGLLWNGYVPLPPPGPPVWNRNLLDFAPTLKALLGFGMFVSVSVALRRRVGPLVLFVAGTAGLLLFGVLQRGASARHCGLLYLVLVATLWWAQARGAALAPWVSRLFGTLLVAQLVGGFYMSCQDLALPFSNGRATAEYLREAQLTSLPIVGQREDLACVVAGFLDQPFYFPAVKRWATRMEGDRERWPVTRESLAADVLRLGHARRSDVILVLSYRIEALGRLELLRCFEGSIVPEDFCVYRAPRPRAWHTRPSAEGDPDASRRSLRSDPGAH